MEAEAMAKTGASYSGEAQVATPTTDVSSSAGGAQLPLPSPPAKKQRALTGMPGGESDADAEVIALSPETLMATPFSMRMHRRRLRIRLELEKKNPGKSTPRRVYLCPEPTCVHHDPARALHYLTVLREHFIREHGEKKWQCDKCSMGYAVHSDWVEHMKTCTSHEYRCDCGILFSRKDSFITHRAFCDALPQESANVPASPASALGEVLDLEVECPETESALHDKAPPLCLGTSSRTFSSPEAADDQQWISLAPRISAYALVQNATQMGTTSSSSSSINKKDITEIFEEDKHEETIRRVDGERGGIVSRQSEKHDIMGLMSQDPSNTRLTIICIIGAQGLGKTTLASLVYWDDATCRSFEARAWMCLSDVCDYEGLLRIVVESLTGVSCRLSERDELELLVREELVGKKFLLILDDLHENNVEICRHLTALLSFGEKGSAVMITTNSNVVVARLGTAHAYYLKPFILHELLNMETPDSLYSLPLKSIISTISSEYYGFPMFDKVIRGILYSELTQNCLDTSCLREFFGECLGDTLDSKLSKILSKPGNPLHDLFYLSYSYLRPNQKRCLVYCSLFPRNYTYNKDKLLRLWMSQGFIMPERENDRNSDCEDAFDELLYRSFFDNCPSSELKEQKYVMHEFSSHLARSASGDEFFRAHGHELHCTSKDVRHLSITPRQCDSEIYFGTFTEFRNLRTFLLVYNSQLEPTDSQFHVMDVRALDECFHNFRCLKTLDLSNTDLKELPESIGYVTSLCFLGLNNTNLRRLPNSVHKLFNLQTLELQNSAFLAELPNDINNLSSLYHLDVTKDHGPIYFPPGIGGLTNLRTLTTFTVGGISWNCKISELALLNSLKGSLHIRSLNNVENAEDAMGACLAAKELKNLSLEWCHSGEYAESHDRIYVAEHVLDALKPHTLLEELNIKGYYGLEFPSWIAAHSLSDLVSVTLDNCYNCEKLPPLGALPALRCMFIQNLRGLQFITYEFYATGTPGGKSFPKLEVLKLCDMYSLENWYNVLDGDFPSLRSLSIERCPKLNSIPRFQFTTDISIMSCIKLNLHGLQSLQTLKVGSLKQRKCFVLPSELRSLLTLEVICCEHLCSLDVLSSLQSLKHLKFRACPRLKFSQDEPLPDTLETVDVHSNCYALNNWRPNGFEELPDASEVYRKFIRHKCKDKGLGEEMTHEP